MLATRSARRPDIGRCQSVPNLRDISDDWDPITRGTILVDGATSRIKGSCISERVLARVCRWIVADDSGGLHDGRCARLIDLR